MNPVFYLFINFCNHLSFSCAFVMVCDSDENRLQADNVLTYIVLTIRDHVMNMDQKMAEVTQVISH